MGASGMEYIALQYVGKYTPGEIIRDLPGDAAERLIRKGAVKVAAPASGSPEKPETTEAPEEIRTETPAENTEPEEVIDMNPAESVSAAPRKRKRGTKA